MALERDIFSELTGVSRLLSRLRDYRQRESLSPEEWCLGMVAFAIAEADQPELPGEEFPPLYAQFEKKATPEQRAQSLTQLSAFVTRQRGVGWRALLLYAVSDSHPLLAARASTLAVTMAPPQQEIRFTGALALVQLLRTQKQPSAAIVSGLLAPADLRLLPTLTPLHDMPTDQLGSLLPALQGQLNSLSSAWLLPLAHVPELCEPLTLALERLASSTKLVADITCPIPTWNFASPAPQPLHAWSLPEFLPRMLPSLSPYLSSTQLQRLHTAFA